MQGRREPVGVVEGRRLFQEPEVDLGHAGKLGSVARLEPARAHEIEVREHEGDGLVHVRDPRLGGQDRDAEGREVGVRDAGPRGQPLRPAPLLEGGEEAPPPLVADEMRDEGGRLRPVVGPQRRDRERERDRAGFANRLDVEPRGQEAFAKERGGDAKALDGASFHRREAGPDEAFQHVERLAAEHHELHQVGGVGPLVERDQLVPDRDAVAIGEGRGRPHVEPREGMPRVERLFPRREAPHLVAPASRHVLGLNDAALARDVLAVESGADEELGEAVERALEVRRVHFEEVARVRERRARVAEAAVLGDEAVVLARVGILPGAEEQHVLEEVRHSGTPVRIVGASHVHVEGGRRLVGARVGDDEGLEPVLESDRAIAPRVGGAPLDLDAGAGAERGHRRERAAAKQRQQRERRARDAAKRDHGSGPGRRRKKGGAPPARRPRMRDGTPARARRTLHVSRFRKGRRFAGTPSSLARCGSSGGTPPEPGGGTHRAIPAP